MEDRQIVELFFSRNEQALSEAEQKYGNYCFAIANRVLANSEDAKECVNDTLLGAWNAIPPHKPGKLSTFLGKIARRTALKKQRDRSALKRGGTAADVSAEELEECLPEGLSFDEALALSELTEIIDLFLKELPAAERRVFLRRYWFFDSIGDISKRFGYGESKVKMMLKRTRDKLKACLEKEDIWL